MSNIMNSLDNPQLAAMLNGGAVGVLPTDTQYGLAVSMGFTESIERLYQMKHRRIDKPCILLGSSLEQLLEIDGLDRNSLLMAERFWPGAVTVIIPSQATKLTAIHRGTRSVACRVPDYAALRALLDKTGPLLVPSANLEGETPAGDIGEAQAIFGDTADFYVEGGDLHRQPPSTIVAFDEDGLVSVIRQGAVRIPDAAV